MTNHDNLPVVLCEEVGEDAEVRWRFDCPHCQMVHDHEPRPGPHAARCVTMRNDDTTLVAVDSPFRRTGYVLKLKGGDDG